jgi:hypothetical protein
MPRIFWILVLLLSWFYFSVVNLFGILVFPFLVRNFWLPIKIRICRNDVPFSLLHIQRNQTFFSQKLGNESWDKKQRGYYCSGRWCGGLVGSGRAIRPESRLSISHLLNLHHQFRYAATSHPKPLGLLDISSSKKYL